MAKQRTTPLHITTNYGQGMVILCGAEKVFTHRAIADGTAHRYIDMDFVGEQHRNDPYLCADCAAKVA